MDSTVDLRDQLNEFIAEIDVYIERFNTKYSNIDGSLKLCRKFIAEKKFLVSLANKHTAIKEAHLKSSNLRHLKAIIEQIESLENVISVLKVFKDKSHNVLHVDVVCDSGYTWCKAIARNAQSLHLLWKGDGTYGEKNINNQVDDYLKFAQCNPNNYKTPKILFFFAGGVTRELADYLKSRDICVRGEIVELDEETKRKLTYIDEDFTSSDEDIENEKNIEKLINQDNDDDIDQDYYSDNNRHENLGDIKKINLDVTTLIALVSEMTNGGENFPYKQQFLQRQAEWERAQNLNPILEDFMKGKELFVCETAYNDFMNIVNTVGAEKERRRAKELLERIQIVKDNPTARAMALKESSKIKARAKVIFGTGDQLEAVTMTSNVGFVRAAEQQESKFSCFIHQSRALTEKKQLQISRKTN